jgi:hypothetical protein
MQALREMWAAAPYSAAAQAPGMMPNLMEEGGAAAWDAAEAVSGLLAEAAQVRGAEHGRWWGPS